MTDTPIWREGMLLGYAPLDAEHKDFVAVIESAKNAADNQDYTLLENVFDKCYAYARNHFSHEENIMEKTNYPDMMAHMKSHQIFVKNISQLRQELEFAGLDEKADIAVRLADFLRVWFIGHVLSRDGLLKPYVQGLSE